MNRTIRPSVVAGATGAVLLAASCLAAGRSAEQIDADLAANAQRIGADFRYDAAVRYDPRYRAQMAREGGPLYVKRKRLLEELAATSPKVAAAVHHRVTVETARLAFWGVDGMRAELDAAAADPVLATALDGKVGQQLVTWWDAAGNAGAQAAVVDATAALAKTQPTNDGVADGVHLMLTTNPASVGVGQRLTDLLCKQLIRTPTGRAYAAMPNKVDEPLAVAGTTLKGTVFRSDAWRTKVVLVDFWATWCPPCREGVPHLADAYRRYHDQGLEIVGVSSDTDRPTLATFLNDHPEMPWPELFHGGPEWHPLARKFGITVIPTMYLIDRNGLLRSVEAVSTMDDLIPKLLSEPYAAPAKSASGRTSAHAKPTGGVSDDINALAHRAASVGGMN